MSLNPFKGFPFASYFIIGNELCERFNYYGMKAVLSIYLVAELKFTQDEATSLYHSTMFLAYFIPLLGATLADSFFGKFLTIIVLSFVYASGSVVLAVGAMNTESVAVILTIIGLVLIAVGTGGIKPCVLPFGAEQFPDTPDREKYLVNYFAIFYFSINLGSLVSMNLTPELKDLHCLGRNTCYPLAFGLPAFLMITATVIFILGCFFYVNKGKPLENYIGMFFGCIIRAVWNSVFHRDKTVKREHYIDHADDKYDSGFREDVRRVLSVLLIYVPVPVFWALYDQQGSRWTFQAVNMDGEIGDDLYVIKPDQVQAVNPLLILILVPFCQYIIYPLCRKCRMLTTPLQKMAVGGMIAVLSFLITSVLEIELEKTYDRGLVAGEAQLKIVNGLDCNLNLIVDVVGKQYKKTLAEMEMWQLNDISVYYTKKLDLDLTVASGCVGIETTFKPPGLTIKETTTNFYFIANKADNFSVVKSNDFVDISRSEDAKPKIGVMYLNPGPKNKNLKLSKLFDTTFTLLADPESKSIDFRDLTPANYDVSVDDQSYPNTKLRGGGVYMMLYKDGKLPKLVELVEPGSIHMLWQMPQYIVISLAEVMFSISGIEFSYTQSPPTLRALMQSFWLLTTAFGNVIVVIVASTSLFERRLFEFLFFATLMFFVMLIFISLCIRYKYPVPPNQANE